MLFWGGCRDGGATDDIGRFLKQGTMYAAGGEFVFARSAGTGR